MSLDDKRIRAKKGSFAFEYDSSVVHSDLDWFKRFEILVPCFLSKDIVADFHASHTKLYLYEWTAGYYQNHQPALEDRISRHPDWVLNESPAVNHSQAVWLYDLANPSLVEARVKFLGHKIKDMGFDGYFFDCTSITDIKPKGWDFIRKEIEDRYFGRSATDREIEIRYSELLGIFIRQLKSSFDVQIFTNAGYRDPSAPETVDIDLTESFMVSYEHAKEMICDDKAVKLTHFRGWDDPASSNPLQFTKPRVFYAKTRGRPTPVLHLNYSYPLVNPDFTLSTDREAIYYSVAAARLFGDEAYVQCRNADQDVRLNHDDIYFVDMGKPLKDAVHNSQFFSYRVFEHGIVVVNVGKVALSLNVKGDHSFIDTFTGNEVGNRLDIPLIQQKDGTFTPTGRIFYQIK